MLEEKHYSNLDWIKNNILKPQVGQSVAEYYKESINDIAIWKLAEQEQIGELKTIYIL